MSSSCESAALPYLEEVEFLCLLGARGSDWTWAGRWLDQSLHRRLVCIDSEEAALECIKDEALGHPQTKYYLLESPLQTDFLVRKVAWEAVFLKLKTVDGSGRFGHFCGELERAHRAANLLLSDASDCGSELFRHVKARGLRPVRRGMRLAGAFAGVPAIIAGAGPSLEKTGQLLERFQDQALIFAGGEALNLLTTEPHFAASIDRRAPYKRFKQHAFWETPFCFQSRMNPDNFSLIHGEALLFPDSHFSFLNWLDGEDAGFDGGWTVGNFLTALAVLMGCNPIVFVGMDLCYEKGCKYAGSREVQNEGLVEAIDKNGCLVWTQSDWLMARQWFGDLAASRPDISFIDARDRGLELHPSLQRAELEELVFAEQGSLREKVHRAVQKLPFAEGSRERRVLWKESLQRCLLQTDRALQGEEAVFEGEVVYEQFLLPLWKIWSPIFERQGGVISDALSAADKQKWNRILFFQRVLQEQLNAD